MNYLITAIWFFLPAGIANVTPILVAKMPIVGHWERPLDFNRHFRGQPIFGSHKTIRGIVFGIGAAILVSLFQSYLWQESLWLSQTLMIDYDKTSFVFLGGLLGSGALIGDLVESFFKRRLGIKSGKRWIPFDQIDYILGGLIFSYWYQPISVVVIICVILFWTLIHPISSIIGYLTGFKKDWL